ncbi:hypothetical protein BCR44DRAFT_55441 [Catenaria anguillulae PL171]|uniref:Uncharacterized protein n=1 Tax=Catenaria anguillulae PL171 TaxID=765915 RepID=A0A1Y2HP83_9FUNG|nr:hypothetical protein BCR44DRAFT_55441 [Catenaria anguillulae PL171]
MAPSASVGYAGSAGAHSRSMNTSTHTKSSYHRQEQFHEASSSASSTSTGATIKHANSKLGMGATIAGGGTVMSSAGSDLATVRASHMMSSSIAPSTPAASAMMPSPSSRSNVSQANMGGPRPYSFPSEMLPHLNPAVHQSGSMGHSQGAQFAHEAQSYQHHQSDVYYMIQQQQQQQAYKSSSATSSSAGKGTTSSNPVQATISSVGGGAGGAPTPLLPPVFIQSAHLQSTYALVRTSSDTAEFRSVVPPNPKDSVRSLIKLHRQSLKHAVKGDSATDLPDITESSGTESDSAAAARIKHRLASMPRPGHHPWGAEFLLLEYRRGSKPVPITRDTVREGLAVLLSARHGDAGLARDRYNAMYPNGGHHGKEGTAVPPPPIADSDDLAPMFIGFKDSGIMFSIGYPTSKTLFKITNVTRSGFALKTDVGHYLTVSGNRTLTTTPVYSPSACTFRFVFVRHPKDPFRPGSGSSGSESSDNELNSTPMSSALMSHDGDEVGERDGRRGPPVPPKDTVRNEMQAHQLARTQSHPAGLNGHHMQQQGQVRVGAGGLTRATSSISKQLQQHRTSMVTSQSTTTTTTSAQQQQQQQQHKSMTAGTVASRMTTATDHTYRASSANIAAVQAYAQQARPTATSAAATAAVNANVQAYHNAPSSPPPHPPAAPTLVPNGFGPASSSVAPAATGGAPRISSGPAQVHSLRATLSPIPESSAQANSMWGSAMTANTTTTHTTQYNNAHSATAHTVGSVPMSSTMTAATTATAAAHAGPYTSPATAGSRLTSPIAIMDAKDRTLISELLLQDAGNGTGRMGMNSPDSMESATSSMLDGAEEVLRLETVSRTKFDDRVLYFNVAVLDPAAVAVVNNPRERPEDVRNGGAANAIHQALMTAMPLDLFKDSGRPVMLRNERDGRYLSAKVYGSMTADLPEEVVAEEQEQRGELVLAREPSRAAIWIWARLPHSPLSFSLQSLVLGKYLSVYTPPAGSVGSGGGPGAKLLAKAHSLCGTLRTPGSMGHASVRTASSSNACGAAVGSSGSSTRLVSTTTKPGLPTLRACAVGVAVKESLTMGIPPSLQQATAMQAVRGPPKATMYLTAAITGASLLGATAAIINIGINANKNAGGHNVVTPAGPAPAPPTTPSNNIDEPRPSSDPIIFTPNHQPHPQPQPQQPAGTNANGQGAPVDANGQVQGGAHGAGPTTTANGGGPVDAWGNPIAQGGHSSASGSNGGQANGASGGNASDGQNAWGGSSSGSNGTSAHDGNGGVNGAGGHASPNGFTNGQGGVDSQTGASGWSSSNGGGAVPPTHSDATVDANGDVWVLASDGSYMHHHADGTQHPVQFDDRGFPLEFPPIVVTPNGAVVHGDQHADPNAFAHQGGAHDAGVVPPPPMTVYDGGNTSTTDGGAGGNVHTIPPWASQESQGQHQAQAMHMETDDFDDVPDAGDYVDMAYHPQDVHHSHMQYELPSADHIGPAAPHLDTGTAVPTFAPDTGFPGNWHAEINAALDAQQGMGLHGGAVPEFYPLDLGGAGAHDAGGYFVGPDGQVHASHDHGVMDFGHHHHHHDGGVLGFGS